jgi:8-oxo-dGTP pyrophosphatase MutT (NUDIX family)
MKHRLRASAVCIHEENILVFKAIDPTSKKAYFFLPGGKIESNETPQACAIRETWEETGYRVGLQDEVVITKEYIFQWDGEDHHCTTYFYPVMLIEDFHDPRPIQDADYNHGPVWIPTVQIDQIFSYHPDILSAVKDLTIHRYLGSLA